MGKFRKMTFSHFALWILTLAGNFLTSFPQRRFSQIQYYDSVPKTSFSCQGRQGGYYADMEAQCQAYHMCNGRQQYSYLCPKYTLFNQKYMVCDHFVAVDCSKSDKYYHLNDLIGKVPSKNQRKQKNKQPNITPSNNRISRANQHKVKQPTSLNVSPLKTNIHKNSQNFISTVSNSFSQPKSSTVRPFPTSRSIFKQNTGINVRKSSLKTTPGISHPFLPKSTSKLFKKPGFTSISIGSRGTKGSKPFTIDGRGKKVRFKVAKAKNGAFTRDGRKLRPILVRRRGGFVDHRSFTVAPDVLTSTPASDSSDEDKTEVTTISPRVFTPLPDILIPPPRQSIEERLPLVPQFLIPPFNSPVMLHAENQELRTPLSISNNLGQSVFRNSKNVPLDRPVSRVSFGTIRGNPDFFIPEPGLVPPLPGNHLDSNIRKPAENEHSMTMTFTDKGGNTKTFLFPVNPNCPNCHPAFLRPNQCKPCVIIK